MDMQTITCQNCQTPNPARNLYCQSCGKPLIQMPAPPITPQPPAAAFVPPPENFPPPRPAPSWPNADPGEAPGMQSMPPQQPVAAAAPPAPLALEHLGAWRDGWADLIAGKANLASEVEQSFVNQLKTHDIPLVMVERNEYFGKFAQKTYLIVRNPTGAAAVHIGSAGNDLSLSWSLYAPTHLNGRMIGMMLGIAFAISFLTTLGVRDAGLFFFGSVFGTFRWLLPVAFFALIAGKVWKGDWWHFFIESTGEMANDDLTALSLAVHQSLQSAVEDAGMDRMALRPKLEFKGSIARHLF